MFRGIALVALLSGCALFGTPAELPPGPAPLPLAADREARAPLAVRWIGHASTLIRMGETEIVTDPYLRESLVGMPRLTPVGLVPGELPRPRAVLVSHLHFDHCDQESLRALAGPESTLVLPRGAARQLPPLGFGRVVELSSWEWVDLGELRVTAVPVDHFGGRYGSDAWMDLTYTGYVLEAAGRRVVFAGDTGYVSDWARQVGRRFPGADLALIPIAPYREGGVDSPIHVGPSGAMRIFADLGAERLIPIHYEAFYGRWRGEPASGPRTRIRKAASDLGVGDRLWDLHPGEALAIDGERAWRLSANPVRAQTAEGAVVARPRPPPPAGGGAGEASGAAQTAFRAANPVMALLSRALPSPTLRVSANGGLTGGVAWEVEALAVAFRTLDGPHFHPLGAPMATRAAGAVQLHLAAGLGASPVAGKTAWGAAELRGTAGWEDLTFTLGGGWYARGAGPFATVGVATFDGLFGLSVRAPLTAGGPWLLSNEIVWH